MNCGSYNISYVDSTLEDCTDTNDTYCHPFAYIKITNATSYGPNTVASYEHNIDATTCKLSKYESQALPVNCTTNDTICRSINDCSARFNYEYTTTCEQNTSSIFCIPFWGLTISGDNQAWISKDKSCSVEQKKVPKTCFQLTENGQCSSSSICSTFDVTFENDCESNQYVFCERYGAVTLSNENGNSAISLSNISAANCKITSDAGKRIEQYCDTEGKCGKDDCENGTWVENFTQPGLCVNNRTVYCEPYSAVRLKYPYTALPVMLHDDDTHSVKSRGCSCRC